MTKVIIQSQESFFKDVEVGLGKLKEGVVEEDTISFESKEDILKALNNPSTSLKDKKAIRKFLSK